MDNINLSINQLLNGIKVLNWNIEHSKILYEILIEPITDIIKDKETLCIIPEGKLNYIPFQALLNSKRQKYLIEDYAIYYSPSLSSLKWLRTKTIKENKNLLAFGDCDFSGEKNINTMREKLIALPATGEEVKALNVIYSPNANIFLGSNATESNFNNQSTKFGIIHLATHSLVNEALPLFSSIAFSKENGEDGFLEAREIIQMELNAQLVILSACKTAFGKQIAGEGMLGLTRAFFTAGIPSVVASLWQVEDNATKVLMVEFHKRIKEGNTPDLALKGAQIYMIKNSGYTDPLFWSPFILVGDNQ
jgi:CHAT domain-containing protein